MRLLQIQGAGTFSLINFEGGPVPPYAILSHTWGADDEEVTFSDLALGTEETKAAYRKLAFCGAQAKNDGLQFFWIDTCCIDRSSSSELSEAIISMFRWYKGAAKCYVYLSDVSIANFATNGQTLQESRWFKRGWTLQELLAPTYIEFFSRELSRLGDKESLLPRIVEATGIPFEALRGNPLSQFSIKARISWLGERQTKREEDRAYCLLGLLDIQMVPLYGEGQRMAFRRLFGELSKSSPFQSLALAPRGFFAEPTKRNYSLSTAITHSRNPDLVGRSDESTTHSANANIPDYQDHPNSNVAMRSAVSEFGDDLSDPRERELCDSQLEVGGSDNVPRSFTSLNDDTMNTNEHASLQLRPSLKLKDDAIVQKASFPEKYTTNKSGRSNPKPLTGGLVGSFRRRGTPYDATSILPNHVASIDPETDLLLQLTKSEDYAQGIVSRLFLKQS